MAKIWVGRALCLLVVLFMVADAVTHMMKIQPVLDAFKKLEIPESTSGPLGALVLLLVVLFLVPRTRVAAAVLLTGYLGGAVAIHVRAGSTPFEMVFPVIIGGLLWSGLALIDARARGILRAPDRASNGRA